MRDSDKRTCKRILLLELLILLLAALVTFLAVWFTGDAAKNEINEQGKGSTVIRTSLGSLRGRRTKAPQGGDIEEYLGIPYAKPPIGLLRYADPQPYGQFPNGKYEATDLKNSCIQYIDKSMGDFVGLDMWNAKNRLSEDCLFLNIWVPKKNKSNMAVMIWIFGGGFYSGTNALWTYDGKALAAHTDVIVVSITSRVGSFGYLSTGDGRIKGNFGMKDQVMALKWIKDNIKSFDGDPNKITLFGESAGAASVGYHMLSENSQDLFQRAIFQSGSPDSHWSFMTQKQSEERSSQFFKSVNCANDENVLGCLRALSTDTIQNNEWVTSNFVEFPWVPTIDGDFLVDSPHNLLKEGKFQKKEILAGANKDEGTFWILFSVDGLSKDTESLLSYQQFLNGVDVVDWDLNNATKRNIILKYKPKQFNDGAGYRDALDKISGDRSFTCPTVELADLVSEAGVRTYFYHLTYRASNEIWPPWMGVIHGADITWVFGMPLNVSRGYNSDDVTFAKDVMDYWANFAKTGHPNGPDLPEWPIYGASKQYLELKAPSDYVVHNTGLRKDHCELWKKVNDHINEAITETSLGRLSGLLSEAPQGGTVVEYLGIPYAKPPLGNLRYADPEPYGQFTDGRYEATDIKNSCIQYLDTSMGDFVGLDMWNAKNPLSEDCLFLNIWVPKKNKSNMAVMVWIYGGGFYGGSSELWTYDGKALATHTDVIIVSFNYRTGSLGYLSTGDGRIKGNFGMKDQVMALRWLKDHIHSFGGDPNRITLFGESAGAASIGYHMLSEGSSDLFHRAILQSGSPDSHWSFMTTEQAKERSKAFFGTVNCPDDDVILDCLRSLSIDTILNNEWVTSGFVEFPWVPSVDGSFLTDSPYNLLKQGTYQRKDTIMGVNKDEGSFWVLFSVPGLSKDHESLLTYQQFTEGIDIIDFDIDHVTKTEIINLYKPADVNDEAGNQDALDKIAGDRSFTCPTMDLANKIQSNTNTYFYYLSYRASNEVWPPWMGVIHGADISWVFGMPLDQSRGYTPEEVQLSKDVMDYWANFAKNGNPNGEGLPKWSKHMTTLPSYLEIRGTQDYVIRNETFREEYCTFWNRVNQQFNTG